MGLDSTALGREWLTAGDSAMRAPLRASLPSREAGVYRREEARAVAWRFSLRDGERLEARLQADGRSAQLFLDLFEIPRDSNQALVHHATANPVTDAATDSLARVGGDSVAARIGLTYEAAADAEYVIRLQPELLRSGRYTLELRVVPQLGFPVAGRGNAAIQSEFGVDRDGGARAHQGIDIFAPRGTPVLASVDGTIRSTSPNARGGNVVWLSDPQRQQSLYYAHLDAHAVEVGQSVRIGDTLGFVGNTGNARTTPPHLHFGIYRRGQGAIDPLRHIRRVTDRPPPLRGDLAVIGKRATLRNRTAALRSAPDTDTPALRQLSTEAELQVMGATGAWYRVQLDDGTAGYLPLSALRPLGP